jgi:hypothetical protein
MTWVWLANGRNEIGATVRGAICPKNIRTKKIGVFGVEIEGSVVMVMDEMCP